MFDVVYGYRIRSNRQRQESTSRGNAALSIHRLTSLRALTSSTVTPRGSVASTAMKTLLAWDFDWTLVNENSDPWVVKQLGAIDLFQE